MHGEASTRRRSLVLIARTKLTLSNRNFKLRDSPKTPVLAGLKKCINYFEEPESQSGECITSKGH